METKDSATGGLSRRRVVKGAAWAAPVIAAATAAPAFAASPCTELILAGSCHNTAALVYNSYYYSFQDCDAPNSVIEIHRVDADGWSVSGRYRVGDGPLLIWTFGLGVQNFTFFYTIGGGPEQQKTFAVPSDRCGDDGLQVFSSAATSEEPHFVFRAEEGDTKEDAEAEQDEETSQSPEPATAEEQPTGSAAQESAAPSEEAAAPDSTEPLPSAGPGDEPVVDTPSTEPTW